MTLSASDEPTLLFLHGVGTGDPDARWRERLNESLVRIGYPSLDEAHVIAPRYPHALKGFDEEELLPPLVRKAATGEAARKNRREFERRTRAIEFRLGRQDRGPGLAVGDVAAGLGLATPFFVQARKYLKDPGVRAGVLNRILAKVPESGRLVIVGHSLGSVIAADLVRRLPEGIEVVGMVTIGSPLASGPFDLDKLGDVMREPPTHLAWWVSFWEQNDLVSARRGVSSVFPWMIDFQVHTAAATPLAAHQAVTYLSHDVVAEAVGFGLFGSRSKEVAVAEKGLDIPTDTAESFALLALRYAHLVKVSLSGEHRERYGGALRHVQAHTVELLKTKRAEAGSQLPSEVARLAFDMSDPRAEAPTPQPARHLPKEDALVALTVLLGENVIRPYEIEVTAGKKQSALQELAAEMGLGSAFGADVFAAGREARAALSSGGVNWVRLGAIGAGAVALVAASGGLAIAAGAGLAGAAAITSALAAFGPGGMIGGLLTAGTLVTAGGGGIAFGLASQGTSADAVEAVVAAQLTAEILRKRHGLEANPAVWRNFVEMEMELRREHERLDEFSDRAAPSVTELNRKVAAVERAIAHLTSLGIGEAGEDRPSRSDARPKWFKWPTPSDG